MEGQGGPVAGRDGLPPRRHRRHQAPRRRSRQTVAGGPQDQRQDLQRQRGGRRRRQPGRTRGGPPRPLLLVPAALGEQRRGRLGPPLLCTRRRRGAHRHLGGGGARDRQARGPRPVLRRLPRQRARPADHCHIRELGVSAPSRHQAPRWAHGAPKPDAGPAQHRRARGRDPGPGAAATGGAPVVAQVAVRPPDLSASGVRGRLRRWHRFPPVLLALACLTAALMAVPVAASLRNADPASDDVARTLGVGPVSRFFRVTLPSIRFALLGGVLIISLYLLAEYGAFAILLFHTSATAIFTEYSLRFNGQTASLFSLIL